MLFLLFFIMVIFAMLGKLCNLTNIRICYVLFPFGQSSVINVFISEVVYTDVRICCTVPLPALWHNHRLRQNREKTLQRHQDSSGRNGRP